MEVHFLPEFDGRSRFQTYVAKQLNADVLNDVLRHPLEVSYQARGDLATARREATWERPGDYRVVTEFGRTSDNRSFWECHEKKSPLCIKGRGASLDKAIADYIGRYYAEPREERPTEFFVAKDGSVQVSRSLIEDDLAHYMSDDPVGMSGLQKWYLENAARLGLPRELEAPDFLWNCQLTVYATCGQCPFLGANRFAINLVYEGASYFQFVAPVGISEEILAPTVLRSELSPFLQRVVREQSTTRVWTCALTAEGMPPGYHYFWGEGDCALSAVSAACLAAKDPIRVTANGGPPETHTMSIPSGILVHHCGRFSGRKSRRIQNS